MLRCSSARSAACDVSYSSNFFSVVMRDAATLAELGRMDAEVSFEMDNDGVSQTEPRCKCLRLM